MRSIFTLIALCFSFSTFGSSLDGNIKILRAGCEAAKGSQNNAYRCYSKGSEILAIKPQIKKEELINSMCIAGESTDGENKGYLCFQASIEKALELEQDHILNFVLSTCQDVSDDNHSGYECFKSSFRKL